MQLALNNLMSLWFSWLPTEYLTVFTFIVGFVVILTFLKIVKLVWDVIPFL